MAEVRVPPSGLPRVSGRALTYGKRPNNQDFPDTPTGNLLGLNNSNGKSIRKKIDPLIPNGNLNKSNSNSNSNSNEFEYAVIYDVDLDVFVKEVENRIKEGWKLHGGFAVDNGKYYQAIVIHTANKELSEVSMGGRRSTTKKNR